MLFFILIYLSSDSRPVVGKLRPAMHLQKLSSAPEIRCSYQLIPLEGALQHYWSINGAKRSLAAVQFLINSVTKAL